MIYMMIGVQGSGKSTYSKALASKLNCEIISTDGVRKANPGIDPNLVWTIVYDKVAEAIKNNQDAIYDATNVTTKVRERFFDNIHKRGINEFDITAIVMDTPYEECYARVQKRNNDPNELFLPLDAIASYSKTFMFPYINEGFKEIRIIRNQEVSEIIKRKINLKNDYSSIAHPIILKELEKRMKNSYNGYGEDDETDACKKIILRNINNQNADVHFLFGGTSTNKIMIDHALKGYEAVIACDTGHINVHETGAIEANGRKILTVPNSFGKLLPERIEEIVLKHPDYHMVKPKMVYISNSTEYGTVYTKDELLKIKEVCKKYNLYLFIDGARLYAALNSDKCDYDLPFIALVADAFYIGGTKSGLLFGEALVVINDELKANLKYSIKRNGGMIAKGFIPAIMFKAAFEKDLFAQIAKNENDYAKELETKLKALGVKFLMDASSNQIFPVVSRIEKIILEKYIDFETWNDLGNEIVIRFVTNFMTKEEDINQTIKLFKDIKEGSLC